MTEKYDEFWNKIAGPVSDYLGMSEPDLVQAQEELDAAPDAPYTENQIQSMIRAVSTGQVYNPAAIGSPAWLDDDQADRRTVADMQAVLNRNRGKVDPKIQKKLDEFRRKLLGDKQDDEQTPRNDK